MYMQPIEVVLAVILVTVIVMDVRLPQPAATFVGSLPGMAVVLGVVLYLFTQSSVLGVLGILAAFVAVQHSGGFSPLVRNASILPNVTVDGQLFTPTSQFPVTLEETIIRNLVSVVNFPGRGSFSSYANTHDAADV